MVYDENIAKDDERISFRKELDQYLSQRKQISPKKREKPNKSNITLEIYSEGEPEQQNKVSFFRRFLNLFKRDKVIEEVIEEEVIEEEPLEVSTEEDNNDFEELEEERESSGFLRRFINLFKKIFTRETIEDVAFEDEEEPKPNVTLEDLETDLKITFKFVKTVLTSIPPRYINRIKELPEFREYRDVVKRYNERHKK
ncbi:MAG: hypothetical protein PWR32_428 [Candidatus Woesearchaeota archaeon]|nr:hypothetical protein [Candidatus Woesearchaeota archaeon]